MARLERKTAEEIKDLNVHCPACKWRGLGEDCKPAPDDLVRCPRCGFSVEREWLDHESDR